MSKKERLVNNGKTALDGAITNGQTSIDVLDGSVLPASGDFRIIVDQEIMLVTANSSNTLTVERGYEGTLAVAHSTGKPVSQILTKGGLQRYLRDSIPMFDQPSETSNRLNVMENAAGTALTVASFSWVNQGTSVASDYTSGGIFMQAPVGASINLRALVISQPSTPYTVTSAVLFGVGSDGATSISGGDSVGLCFRESGTGKLATVGYRGNGNVISQAFTSPTVFGTNNALKSWRVNGPLWCQLENDGTNLNYSVSIDGINWYQLHTELLATWFTTAPDQVGLFIHNGNNHSITQASFLSWIEE